MANGTRPYGDLTPSYDDGGRLTLYDSEGNKVPDWPDYLTANFGGFFASGTPYVPRDMLAYVHEGEGIFPKQMNPFAGGKAPSQPVQVIFQGVVDAESFFANNEDVIVRTIGNAVRNSNQAY